MELYEYLQQPKSLEELLEIAEEKGVIWTAEQMELWLLLAPRRRESNDGKAFFINDDRRTTVLRAIEQALTKKKLAFISKDIMPLFESDVIITPAEIVAIAEKSGIYESPNGKVIKRRK
jgi:hypothetical protein